MLYEHDELAVVDAQCTSRTATVPSTKTFETPSVAISATARPLRHPIAKVKNVNA
jgi:hypothetical protein